MINAVLEDGTKFKTKHAAKTTRPLLSVHQMVQNGHRLELGKYQSNLVLKGGKRIPPRQVGKLYMLDVWCQVLKNWQELRLLSSKLEIHSE